MKFSGQKRMAAAIAKGAKKRVRFQTSKLTEIKEAITRADIRSLLSQKAITLIPKRGISQGRARFVAKQKAKGRRRGQGSRKGTKNARLSQKTVWIAKVRLQRTVLRNMRKEGKLSQQLYANLYRKVKGGFFRSRRHLELYISEGKK